MSASLQVTANNLSVVHPSSLEPPTSPSDSLLSKGPTGQLTALCDALQACLTCPLPQDIVLALLLSGVTAGVPATPPSQTNDTAARNQVWALWNYLARNAVQHFMLHLLIVSANDSNTTLPLRGRCGVLHSQNRLPSVGLNSRWGSALQTIQVRSAFALLYLLCACDKWQ